MAEGMEVAGLASSTISFVNASLKIASIYKEFYKNCGQLPTSIMHKGGKIKKLQQSLERLKNYLRLYIGERTMRLSKQSMCA